MIKKPVLKCALYHWMNQMSRFIFAVALLFLAPQIANAVPEEFKPGDADKPYDFTPGDANKPYDFTPGDVDKPFDYKPGNPDK